MFLHILYLPAGQAVLTARRGLGRFLVSTHISSLKERGKIRANPKIRFISGSMINFSITVHIFLDMVFKSFQRFSK